MADIFFHHLLADSERSSLPSPATDGASVLIAGDGNSHETEMLFRCAVARCDGGDRVVFVTPTPFKKMPTPFLGAPVPDVGNVALLRFAYVEETASLVEFLSSFHVHWADVRLLVVEGLERYVGQLDPSTRDLKLAFVFALLLDASSLPASGDAPSGLRLLASCDEPSRVSALRRFFGDTVIVTRERGPGEDRILRVLPSRSKRRREAKLLMRDGSLRVEISTDPGPVG